MLGFALLILMFLSYSIGGKEFGDRMFGWMPTSDAICQEGYHETDSLDRYGDPICIKD